MLKLEWNIFDQFLRKTFPKDQELWLNYIKFLSSSDKEIFISVPNQLYKERVYSKYYKAINQLCKRQFNKKLNLTVMIGEEEDIIVKPSNDRFSVPQKSNNPTKPKTPSHGLKLNIKYIFDSFVVGNNSLLAHAAARRIADVPGENYNPFFLYGGVGLGKTHLMQAIGHQVTIKEPFMEVIYLTSEQFTNEYIVSLQKGQVHAFRLKYRNVDIFLIDDIQFLEGKEGIQEELFHTFNMLKESGKQMVFTSDRSPRELKTIKDRLISRFSSGLVADIKPPDLETREAIIRKKMIDNQIVIDREIINFLATNITNNVRELEASVIKLKSIVDLLNEKLTLKRVEEELYDTLNCNLTKKHISVEPIQKEVANYYSISYSDMKSKKRTDAIAKPRQVAVYLTKLLTKLSTTEIGNEFGGRNHSTIIAACKKIDKELMSNESTRNDIDHLKAKLLRI
jgi:chromosomal replication initiator protein